MDQDNSISSEDMAAEARAGRPRLRDWVWRPWYAKLWWTAIALFWLASLAVSWLGFHRLPVDASVLLFMAIVLHPQAALPVLGFGYARALLKHRRHYGVSATDDDEIGYRRDDFSHGLFGRDRFMSYLSDPADPRSPLSRLNPANPHYIHRPDN